VRVLAIVCARNEAVFMRSLIGGLIADGLDVVLIDHGSSDETVELAASFLGRGLLAIRELPWGGRFSLAEQLDAKRESIAASDHEWIVHVDADEWLSAPRSGQRLVDAIEIVDLLGYNCIDFNEFVFVPNPGEDHRVEHHRELAHRYYAYRPNGYTLHRAWRRDAQLDNRAGGGHALEGELRPYPVPFVLRHYIALSEEHVVGKYLVRRFARDEVLRGWHADRILTTRDNLVFPPTSDPNLRAVRTGAPEELDASAPRDDHYWHWGSHANALAVASAGVRG